LNQAIQQLKNSLQGTLHVDSLTRVIYATDASVYKKKPLAVAYPKSSTDIQKLIRFADSNKIGLIPRSGGTSLAGQCVGDGIVVDVSRYLNRILEIDTESSTARVQPGVIRDQLNAALLEKGLFFGPNTSTSKYCTLGGMVGNNSSGSTSIRYGVTRDKVVSVKGFLSDGSEVVFKDLDAQTLEEKTKQQNLEGKVYQLLVDALSQEERQKQIRDFFPDVSVHRRNTGYALDALLDRQPFNKNGKLFSLCPLIAGSEGTLFFITEITLKLDMLPPPHKRMVVAHFDSIKKSLKAVVPAMKHELQTCELMDKAVLDCTKNNKSQLQNRFFIEKDPQALLLLELSRDSQQEVEAATDTLCNSLSECGAYAIPVLKDQEIDQALELRKSGLGALGNMIGDAKAVACVEDTAVPLTQLSSFIEEFTALMASHNQKAVYYAHAGAGELHLRPILNLKKTSHIRLFRTITSEVAQLVKKYRGSFSGEHGDGIVRSEFIPKMVGEDNYAFFKELKSTFDPKGIFNPGKIVDPYPMDQNLRAQAPTPEIKTTLDFSSNLGIVRAAEQCNGAGVCRSLKGGTMCPSYRATRNEKDTTRARANALREFLYQPGKANRFDHPELKEVFELCLSCKACASECPSNVDVSAFKAEFLHQYYKSNTRPFREKVFGNAAWINRMASKTPRFANAMLSHPIVGSLIKKVMGVASKRTWPVYDNKTLLEWSADYEQKKSNQVVYLLVDEFINYSETHIGIKAVKLLNALGYQVFFTPLIDSGRSQLSLGLLDEARICAEHNVQILSGLLNANTPLLGLEPSTLLGFRDEYPKLVGDKSLAKSLANNCYMIEAFIAKEIERGKITSASFTDFSKNIHIHTHCHHKALDNQQDIITMLELPKNHTTTIIPSGCCGMAGSFGYAKERYEVSMQIGEEILFPHIRKMPSKAVLAANGTSCRHQVYDGTKTQALHPVEILHEALINSGTS
jgi:FAD/FMN-containing dehydrogenase/Fe-S oxidoreductase